MSLHALPAVSWAVAASWHQHSSSSSSSSPWPSPSHKHTVSSWLREQEGPRGAPRGFPPCRVPFICCSADVGFGSCLTCINYRATAPSLWQIQLWSSCPESAVPEAELCLCPRWVQLCPDHLHISCAHVDRLSLAGKV